MYCGKPLTAEDCVIEHFFPQKYGGSDALYNLRPVCDVCHQIRANHPFRLTLFQQYLQQMLLHDARFENVRTDAPVTFTNGEKVSFDIVFTQMRDGKQVQYVIEAKGLTAATAKEISSATQQLTYYKNNCPNTKFILAIPAVLAGEYRQQLHSAGIILWDAAALRSGAPDIAPPTDAVFDIYDDLLRRLKSCEPGRESWQIYQKLVGEILAVLFCPPLDHVSEQNADANYKNRRDFVLPNYTDSGCWKELRHTYRAEFVVVDAKNLKNKIEKDDILQVAHYLKIKGPGLFGLIFSRVGAGESAEQHLKDIWQHEDKMIIVLDDSDVEQMLLSKKAGNDPCRLILTKIEEFRLQI